MAISSRDPLVAERKRIKLKVPATAIEVPKLHWPENNQGHEAGKQGQADSEFSGVEGSIFVSPSKCQTED